MLQLAQGHRPRRAGEWTESKAVTFIVTLAASRSFTLAAARAGMSRKSTYALKRRDSSFAAAWNTAIAAVPPSRAQGNKGDEVHDPRVGRAQGNKTAVRTNRSSDAQTRARFFATLANQGSDSRSSALARAWPLP